MGKDLKGKELGVGIVQQTDGLYVARFTDRYGNRPCGRCAKCGVGDEKPRIMMAFIHNWYTNWYTCNEQSAKALKIKENQRR